MTNKTDEYRAKAEHCRQMADQVVSPMDKEMWLQLAADWLSMASVHERFGNDQSLVWIAIPRKAQFDGVPGYSIHNPRRH
jgi:hypothetical protein